MEKGLSCTGRATRQNLQFPPSRDSLANCSSDAPKGLETGRRSWAHVFTAALSIIKRWKQPKCPSMDGWITNVVRPYGGLLLSHKGNNVLTQHSADEP